MEKRIRYSSEVPIWDHLFPQWTEDDTRELEVVESLELMLRCPSSFWPQRSSTIPKASL